ncbi:3D domain-containing protein [Oceanobacillus senegalensis]|uniref:3D domain-containing protein n=1 Tax=Oceanobacillus senegalensis TaxID=1936063 RepID=UPI000A30BB51|nr:3D domain-containing protein [Oceanobacillus senegalensis]
MRKLVTVLATGLILALTSVTTVSAEEYEIKKGDTLWDIANEHNTTVDSLIDINDLKTTLIHPKQILLLHEEYTVQKGDTLISIADKYDVSVEDLKKWNNLDSDIIVIGQDLEIKGVTEEDSEEKDQFASVQTKEEDKAEKAEKASKDEPSGKKMTVTATAYTANCEGCTGITYTGVDLNKNPDAKVIAVDPDVIPLGSEVYVEGYGYATAADIGSAIQGSRIDLFIPELSDAKEYGVKDVEITIVNEA